MDKEVGSLDFGCCHVAELSFTNREPPVPSQKSEDDIDLLSLPLRVIVGSSH